MYKVNDYIVYKKDVCKIKEIRKNKMTESDYYILNPIDDESLIIDVPVDNRMGFIRDIVSYDEALKLIDEIPNVEILDNMNEKYIEREYKDLINSGKYVDLIKIIKTSYLRNKERVDNKKKLSDKDTKYFELAEKYLYNELSIALEMSFDKTKEFIINRVDKLIK